MLVNDRERELGTLDMSTFPQSYCCGTYNLNRKSRSCDEGKSLVSAGSLHRRGGRHDQDSEKANK